MTKANRFTPDTGGVVIYSARGHSARIEVRLKEETVWLNLNQCAALFGRDKSVISRHYKSIFSAKEFDRKSVVAKIATTGPDGKIYQVEYFNLDAIISLGYRVNSQRATQFRIWATNILRKHLVDGYTLNEKRLKEQSAKYAELRHSIDLLGNLASLESVNGETRSVVQIINEYARALDLLDDYDYQRLAIPKGTRREICRITLDSARAVVEEMRRIHDGSSLMGREKDKSFESAIGALYQTFSGKEVYPTVEEKAAHLLYFVTKNHSFVDGNKRIAAALFV